MSRNKTHKTADTQTGKNKRVRSGSNYINSSGTAVERQPHLWTPPPKKVNPENQSTKTSLKLTPAEKKSQRQTVTLERSLEEIVTPEITLEFYREFRPSRDSGAFDQPEITYKRKYADFERFQQLHIEARIPIFKKFFLRRKISESRYWPNTKEDKAFTKKIKAVPTEKLLNKIQQLEKEVSDLLHSYPGYRTGDFLFSTEDTKTFADTTRRILQLKEATIFRAAKGDKEAHEFLKQYEDRIFDMALKEKQEHGFTHFYPTKQVSAQQTCEIVGCTEEELGVYVWLETISPYPKTELVKQNQPGERDIIVEKDCREKPLSQQTFFGNDVIKFKEEYSRTNSTTPGNPQ